MDERIKVKQFGPIEPITDAPDYYASRDETWVCPCGGLTLYPMDVPAGAFYSRCPGCGSVVTH